MDVGDTKTQVTGAAGPAVPDRRRWWTLAVVSAAQLLVVLDGTIVNIALPSAQQALGMSDGNRQWAITAYALAFGGLLLIGGRIGGALGHRRGVRDRAGGVRGRVRAGRRRRRAGDAVRGAGGAGRVRRAAGPGGAVAADDHVRRSRAGPGVGVFAAVGAAGSAVGLIAGGLLTEYVGWRWCLYINVPIALLAVFGASAAVPPDRPLAGRGRLDVAGALLSSRGSPRWCTRSPGPNRSGGDRPRCSGCWPPGCCCWPRSSPSRRARPTRCSRCGSCSTGSGRARSSPSP
ncbi:MFS transporter [Actinomadura sp. CNU-125]|uniref:MFS transporter n=1 Tax=Actinomadura sp. CNU-125 TaxID=1904961 RepID=UPI000B229D6B